MVPVVGRVRFPVERAAVVHAWWQLCSDTAVSPCGCGWVGGRVDGGHKATQACLVFSLCGLRCKTCNLAVTTERGWGGGGGGGWIVFSKRRLFG